MSTSAPLAAASRAIDCAIDTGYGGSPGACLRPGGASPLTVSPACRSLLSAIVKRRSPSGGTSVVTEPGAADRVRPGASRAARITLSSALVVPSGIASPPAGTVSPGISRGDAATPPDTAW